MVSTPPRSRRKVSRVNYAEDVAASDLQFESVDTAATAAESPIAAKSSRLGRKSTAVGNSTVITSNSNGKTLPLSDKDLAAQAVKDKFAMNWQRKFSPTEKLSLAMNFDGAHLLSSGALRFPDGSELKPDGKFTFHHVIIMLRFLTCLISSARSCLYSG